MSVTLFVPDPLSTVESCVYCGNPADREIDGLPVCETHQGTPCERCGRFVRIGMWPTCRIGPRDNGEVFNQNAVRFDPVVVHFNPKTQTYRFPGAGDTKVPGGFVRQELTTVAEIRKLQKHVNAHERRQIDERIGREHAFQDHQDRGRRSELRQAMQHMSPLGRAFAQVAMARNDARRPKAYEPGFYLDAFENNRSNRDPHCDRSTGWKDRY